MEYFRDKSVLVTGASSGIGEALAWQLARGGARLTLAARRVDRLESLAAAMAAAGHRRPLAVGCDVGRDGELERTVAVAVSQWGGLDAAFANAGFGVVGPLLRLTLEDYRRQFETNVFGVLRTVYAALPELERSRGNLAITASVAGWVAMPGASPYAMSKFALRALADALTPELAGAGVKVTLISPGFVVSDFRRVDNQGEFHAERSDEVPAWLQMGTERAARTMLRAVARGRREVIFPLHGKVLVGLQRFCPSLLRVGGRRWVRRYRRWNGPARNEDDGAP
ncbi:MAG TPA: SDR family NAD(P)-dependent oxidoreductase [Terriglobales bacterium]|nr:SDR family NAD(P)-dependent oxidoreductase [Terriglobales bacterium]